MNELSQFERKCCYCNSNDYQQIECEWKNQMKFKCRKCSKNFMELGKDKEQKTLLLLKHLDDFKKEDNGQS